MKQEGIITTSLTSPDGSTRMLKEHQLVLDGGMLYVALLSSCTQNLNGGVWEPAMSEPKSSNVEARAYVNHNINDEDFLLGLAGFFSPDWVPSYEWKVPMHEVPGGEGSISVLDVYPVGIEITTTDTAFNPMKVWGGTWTVTPAGAKRVWKRTA